MAKPLPYTHATTIGARMLLERLHAGQIQEQYAREHGITRAALAQWERGRVPKAVERAFRVANVQTTTGAAVSYQTLPKTTRARFDNRPKYSEFAQHVARIVAERPGEKLSVSTQVHALPWAQIRDYVLRLLARQFRGLAEHEREDVADAAIVLALEDETTATVQSPPAFVWGIARNKAHERLRELGREAELSDDAGATEPGTE